ncbi:MAG: M60 family metallopeptidase, partial [Verrucomicrobiae bacterium]|nr:M60 family metallopeptidase [Verrucomicrobiae bacterium]
RLIADLKTGGDLRGDDLTAFLESLQALNRAVGPIFPTLENPVTPGADPLVDAVIGLETDLDRSLPPGAMYAIPAAAEYPGAVPEEAERAAVTLSIDGKYRGWLRGRGAGGWAAKEMRPTGVYAAPGEVVKVTVPARVAGEGFEVVIGAYNGGLDNRDRWQRYPKLQRNFPVASRVTEASNALGGLVTIRIPREADYDSLEITIEGGVRAPLFVEGQTDPKAWKDEIRKYPAPWAELAGKRIILALPSEHIRNLGDPDKVLAVWDEILDKAAELCGGVNRDDYRAERIVFERQPSAGYMHSGYPVAAPQDKSVAQAVDARALREEGNWGFFHEYGHNHQHDLWSLPGTGETTCNLWSVYLFEEYIGKKREEGHNAVRPLERRERMNAYFSSGRNFDSEWSMWVALEAYLQVQEAFGWEPFKKVFAEYNTLPEREWPKTQQEKNDQWVLRLSRACGKNLAPFWAAWNLPLSEKVFTELAGLPAWEDHPVARYFK